MESTRNSTTVHVRCDEELKEQFKEAVEAESSTMTESIVAHMEAVAAEPARDGGSYLPDDDELREAYDVLDRHAAPDTRRIDVETARTVLADELGRPKGTIDDAILRPLERHEPRLVVPSWGALKIR
jgi:hypothetical protein